MGSREERIREEEFDALWSFLSLFLFCPTGYTGYVLVLISEPRLPLDPEDRSDTTSQDNRRQQLELFCILEKFEDRRDTGHSLVTRNSHIHFQNEAYTLRTLAT